MIDWLRREPNDLAVDVAGRSLPILLRRNKRSKRMTMRLSPDGQEVRITLPPWGRTLDALEFAQSRQDWLAVQLEKLPEIETPEPGGKLHYRGTALTIDWRADAARKPVMAGSELLIGGPQAGIAARLLRWLEAEAQSLMEDDLTFFCQRADQPVPRLRLSRAHRRWGSCSTSGDIRINWRLVQAPDHVRRSVVAHEVAHLVHFDHSPAFYAMLNRIFDAELAAADRWLKDHGRKLYGSFG